MVYQIRKLEISDCDALSKLMGQLGHPASIEEIKLRLQLLTSSSEDALFGTEDESGEIIAFLQAKITKTLHYQLSVEICALVVHESIRGKGVGKTLMAAAERWAQSNGIPVIWLRSNIRREDAHSFYFSLGYEIIGTSHFIQKKIL